MVSALSNDHQSLCKGSTATQRVPRGTSILIGAGWRSQAIGEIFKGTDGACADPDTRIFPATGSAIRQSPSSASLCSAPSPVWEKTFIVMRYARNLAVLLNYRSQRSLILTPNKRPRGTLIADQRRACAARPKGKYSRGRMALAPIRTREFSLPRGPIHRPRLPA